MGGCSGMVISPKVGSILLSADGLKQTYVNLIGCKNFSLILFVEKILL